MKNIAMFFSKKLLAISSDSGIFCNNKQAPQQAIRPRIAGGNGIKVLKNSPISKYRKIWQKPNEINFSFFSLGTSLGASFGIILAESLRIPVPHITLSFPK